MSKLNRDKRQDIGDQSECPGIGVYNKHGKRKPRALLKPGQVDCVRWQPMNPWLDPGLRKRKLKPRKRWSDI